MISHFMLLRKSILSSTVIQHKLDHINEVFNALTNINEGFFPFIYNWFDSLWWRYWLFICFVFFCTMLIRGLINLSKRKRISKLAWSVFAFGYILYFIGFYCEGSSRSLWAILLRPAISSTEMFVANSDLLEVCEICKNSSTYMALFSLTHAFAILISIYVVLNWIYQRVKHNLRFNFAKWMMCLEGNKSDLYVFFDTNDSAWTLAKDITKHYMEKNERNKYQIIFVDEPDEIEDDKEKQKFMDLLHIKAFRRSTQERTCSKDVNNALYVRSDKNISSNFTNNELAEIWECMGLKKIQTIIQKTKKNIHLFLFSEDADDNLRAVQNIIEWGKKNTEITQTIEVYCKARYNEKNRIYEELGYLNKTSIHVHIVDDASLAILSLKNKEEYQPIQYVELEPGTALVKSTFEALILGFGQTGRDAFRFLYEYATFAGIHPQQNGDERSPIKIHVYDKNMRILKGGFFAKSPALMEEHNKSRYAFHFLDVNTLAFWEQMKLLINQINYVVIALGDDDINITAAIDLYKFALRYRADLSKKFDVFVRVYSLEKEQEFKMMKDHLYKEMIEEMAEKGDGKKVIINKQRLISFGEKNRIYTYDVIIREETLEKAQIFAYVYDGKYNMNKSYKDNTKEAKECWKEKAKKVKTLADVWDCIRKEEQNMANCWHIPTKIRLIKSTNNPRLFDLTFTMTSKGYMKPKEDLTEGELQVIRNVAKGEHLRWNSLSELQGYETYWGKEEDGNKKFIVQKKLSCLRPFEIVPKGGMPWYSLATATNDELKDTINYDENTVYTSIICDKIKDY